MRHVGQPLPLIDGLAKAAGTLRYAGDHEFPGLLHAKLVLSTRPHARIVRVLTAAATAIPGVRRVFWHANTPHNRYNSAIWHTGQEALEDERMFPPVVRHVGDRVAAVVADSRALAEAAAGLIDVVYADLPACLEPEAALVRTGSPRGADGTPTFLNPLAEEAFSRGDPAGAFARADLVVETRAHTPKTHHCAIETHVCIAEPETGGRIRVLSPCQSVFAVRVVTARALGLPEDRLHVVKAPVGGSFGGKSEPILEPLCAFFAMVLERPVSIRLDRRETFLATRMRAGMTGHMRTALAADGRILARDTEALIDVGAYCTGGHFLPGSMAQRLVRLYDVPIERYRARAVYTNTPPSGAFRGYGSPQIHALAEINLDQAARRLGLDPVKLRLKNLVVPGASEPYEGQRLGNAQARACVQRGARHFDWARRWRTPQRRGRHRMGVGMACAAHINGCHPGFQEVTTATLRLQDDGSIALLCALHDLGCGAETALAQIAAEVLAVAPRRIVIDAADSDVHDYDLGTRASRMTYICGEAIRRAAVGLRTCLLDAAAPLLNCAPGDLSLDDEAVTRRGAAPRRMPLAELAARIAAHGDELPVATETYSATSNPSSYAAHFAEVEVDTLTGRVRVTDYLAVHDIGRAINPLLVEGQIHGGVQIGIGYALFEDVDIDTTSGRMRGDSFARYHLANAPEMPPMEVLLVEKGEPGGPFGAKAVGEIATIPVAPAVVNAVNHALDAMLCELPLTPARIAAWLEEREPLPFLHGAATGPIHAQPGAARRPKRRRSTSEAVRVTAAAAAETSSAAPAPPRSMMKA